jgi:hypothetical protein
MTNRQKYCGGTILGILLITIGFIITNTYVAFPFLFLGGFMFGYNLRGLIGSWRKTQ